MEKSSTKSKKFMKYGIFSIFESKNNIWKIFQKRKKKLLATLNHLISRVFFLGLNFFNFLTGCDTQCSKNLNKVQLLGEVVLHGVSQKALNNERFFLNICFKRTEAHRATTCTHFCYCTIFPLLEHHALWVRLSKKFSSITNYFY